MSDKGVQCGVCELWFHCKCQNIEEVTYKLLGQDKIHFYCSRCDAVAGKLLKGLTEMSLRQDKIEMRMVKVEEDLKELNEDVHNCMDKLNKIDGKVVMKTEIDGRLRMLQLDRYMRKDELDDSLKKLREDIIVVNQKNSDNGKEQLQKQIEELTVAFTNDGPWAEVVKKEVEQGLNSSRKTVLEDVEECMEIERRKNNLVIHGVPETDTDHDIEAVAEILACGNNDENWQVSD